MRPDRDVEWKSRVERKASAVPLQRRNEILAVRRAALSASQVVGDEHWDMLLSIVNERIQSLRTKVDSAIESMKSSDSFDPETLINQKLGVRLWGREIEVLEWVMELPKRLIEQGEHFRELIEKTEQTPS